MDCWDEKKPRARGERVTPEVLPTASATATVGNARAAPTYCSAASNCGTTSYHSTATIHSATIVAASTAILIVWITVATAIMGTAIIATAIISGTTCNHSPSSDRSSAIRDTTPIRGTTPNCTASIRGTTPNCTTSAAAHAHHNLSRRSNGILEAQPHPNRLGVDGAREPEWTCGKQGCSQDFWNELHIDLSLLSAGALHSAGMFRNGTTPPTWSCCVGVISARAKFLQTLTAHY